MRTFLLVVGAKELCSASAALGLVSLEVVDSDGGPGDRVSIEVRLESSDDAWIVDTHLSIPDELVIESCSPNPELYQGPGTIMALTTLGGAPCTLGVDCRALYASVHWSEYGGSIITAGKWSVRSEDHSGADT